MIDALPLDQYEVKGKKVDKTKEEDDEAWSKAERAASKSNGSKDHGRGEKRKRDKKDKDRDHWKEHGRDKKAKRKS
jgi:hypothetical protein